MPFSFDEPNEYIILRPPKPVKPGGPLTFSQGISEVEKVVNTVLSGQVLSSGLPQEGEFQARWAGDTRSIDIKSPDFDFPLVNKTLYQRLGAKSFIYEETFWFEGPSAKEELKRFEAIFTSANLYDKAWDIVHPTKGQLKWTPLRITVKDDPVGSYGLYEVNSVWAEGLEDFKILSGADAEAALANQPLPNLFTPDGFQFYAAQVQQVLSDMERIVRDVTAFPGQVRNTINNAIEFVRNGIATGVITASNVLSTINSLIELPGQISTSFQASLDFYGALFDATAEEFDAAVSDANNPDLANTQSVILSSSVTGLGYTIIRNPTFTTREQTLRAAESLFDFQAQVVEYTDLLAQTLNTGTIENKVYAQDLVFQFLDAATHNTFRYLQSLFYSISAQRRIVLSRPRTPIEIVLTEYGAIGDNYELLDQFININKLTGAEVELLPAGREVIIYA